MKKTIGVILVLGGMWTLGAACTRASEPEGASAEGAEAKKEAKEAAAPAVKEAPTVAPKRKGPCVGPIEEGTPKVVSMSNGDWVVTGSTMTWQRGETDKVLRIGVVSDIKEVTAGNAANAARFLAEFRANKVDLIILAGDIAEEVGAIEKVVRWFLPAEVPVGVVIGNREGVGTYQEAMRRLAGVPHVVDLTRIRRIATPNADIISLPGYYDSRYLHAKDGCKYSPEDVINLEQLVKACDSPVVLVSHGGPRQTGKDAIDRTSEGANVGDPAITEAIKRLKIPFGIFGNVHEAGGRGTDLSGKLLGAGEPHGALYLNPGPLDSVHWMMNDQRESTGMAAILSIEGDQATYRILRN